MGNNDNQCASSNSRSRTPNILEKSSASKNESCKTGKLYYLFILNSYTIESASETIVFIPMAPGQDVQKCRDIK